MSDVPGFGLRILVGAGSFADATAALRIVQQFPSGFCAGLGGILVEEVELLATCRIPDQRIILLSGMTSPAPSVPQVRTLIKADARAFQKLLAHTTRPHDTEWEFSQEKGELVSTALRAAASWDVLVLGYRQLHKVPGKVILLQTSGGSSSEMKAASLGLSNHLRVEPVTFSVKANIDGAVNTPSSNALQFETLDGALAALTRQNAQTVLVDLKHGPVRNHYDLLHLLEVARCPVVVFGASNANLLLEHNTQILPSLAKTEP
jgi:hypothetical protein